MRRIASTSVLFVSLIVALAGCAAGATYPPTAGKTVLWPSTPPCSQIMASGLRYAHQRLAPATQTLIFNLPPNTPEGVWLDIGKRLGDGARAMTESDTSCMTLQQIRLNGGKAEVDVVYLTTEGVWQMATVHLDGYFGAEFKPVFLQRWLIPVDKPAYNPPLMGVFMDAPESPAPSPIIPSTPTGNEPATTPAKH
jgi:hypothetical protein